jgi:hypothetical protein
MVRHCFESAWTAENCPQYLRNVLNITEQYWTILNNTELSEIGRISSESSWIVLNRPVLSSIALIFAESLSVVVSRCESSWVVMSRFALSRMTLNDAESLWMVANYPGFQNLKGNLASFHFARGGSSYENSSIPDSELSIHGYSWPLSRRPRIIESISLPNLKLWAS